MDLSAKQHKGMVALTVLALLSFPFVDFTVTNLFDSGFDLKRYADGVPPVMAIGFAFVFIIPIVLAKLFGKPWERFAVVAGLVWVALFLFNSISQLGSNVFEMSETARFDIGFIFLALLIFLIVRISTAKYFIKRVQIFSLTLFGVAAIRAGFAGVVMWNGIQYERELDLPSKKLLVDNSISSASSEKPNIYFVVVDAYASRKALKKYVDLDISDFIDDAKSRGFVENEDATSPFNVTYLSVGSMLEMDYIVTDNSPAYKNRRRFYPAILTKKSAPTAPELFKKLGYDFSIYGNKWADCAGPHVSCPDLPEHVEMSYELRGFLFATPYVWFEMKFGSKLFEPHPEVSVDAIGNFLNHNKSAPVHTAGNFFFIHQLSPHAPFLFKADCSVRDSFKFNFDNWSQESKPLYADNVKCNGKKLTALFDWVDQNDPDAIVVVTGDHGSRFSQTADEQTRERMSTLSLSRMPERCANPGMSSETNSINLMRMAFACSSGQTVESLPNLSYFAPYSIKGSAKVRKLDPSEYEIDPIKLHKEASVLNP